LHPNLLQKKEVCAMATGNGEECYEVVVAFNLNGVPFEVGEKVVTHNIGKQPYLGFKNVDLKAKVSTERLSQLKDRNLQSLAAAV
jgi:hypothetical protein